MSWEDILKKTAKQEYIELKAIMLGHRGGQSLIWEIEEEYAVSKGKSHIHLSPLFETEEFYKFALPRINKYLQENKLLYSRTKVGSKQAFNPWDKNTFIGP